MVRPWVAEVSSEARSLIGSAASRAGAQAMARAATTSDSACTDAFMTTSHNVTRRVRRPLTLPACASFIAICLEAPRRMFAAALDLVKPFGPSVVLQHGFQ